MSSPEQNLGECPICQTQLIRSSRNPYIRRIRLKGVKPPENAYFPEMRIILYAQWCPTCGWVKRLEAPELPMEWVNKE